MQSPIFSSPWLPLPAVTRKAIFIERHKRFSVRCRIGQQEVWVHTNNTGGMLGLLRPNAQVLVSLTHGEKRKLPWTLERIWIPDFKGGFWAGVNTQLPNKLLGMAFKNNLLAFAHGYDRLQMEVKNGSSRLDACFTSPDLPRLWVECKSVTLVEDGIAAFPDARSERACKHLMELTHIAEQGERAAMFYLVQRPDCQCFGPAAYIDEEYARLFRIAVKTGVEAYAYQAVFSAQGTRLGKRVPLVKT